MGRLVMSVAAAATALSTTALVAPPAEARPDPGTACHSITITKDQVTRTTVRVKVKATSCDRNVSYFSWFAYRSGKQRQNGMGDCGSSHTCYAYFTMYDPRGDQRFKVSVQATDTANHGFNKARYFTT